MKVSGFTSYGVEAIAGETLLQVCLLFYVWRRPSGHAVYGRCTECSIRAVPCVGQSSGHMQYEVCAACNVHNIVCRGKWPIGLAVEAGQAPELGNLASSNEHQGEAPQPCALQAVPGQIKPKSDGKDKPAD